MTQTGADKESRGNRRAPKAEWKSAEQLFAEHVSAQSRPALYALIEQAKDSTIRDELLSLIRLFVPERAHRESVKIVAKLVRSVDGREIADSVIVRDISASGAQLAVSNHLGLSATDLADITLRVRLGTDVKDLNARLVRVINVDANFIVAGFRFCDVSAEIGQELSALQHVQSLRASEIAKERMSQMPATTKGVAPDELKAEPRRLGPKLK